MGTDKAELRAPGSELLLWQKQLQTLEQLQPARIFWSGPARSGIPDYICRVDDVFQDSGPLGGISTCLDLLETDLLVVLAIDMPCMTAAFLQKLLARSSRDVGCVGYHGDFFEPLAAVYPKAMAVLARDQLLSGRYAMQTFVRAGFAAGHFVSVTLGPETIPFFQNWNAPGDLS